MNIDFDSALQDLMAVTLGEFTARRQSLVKELRQAGDRGAAERLAEVRKPTVPLASANQVARYDPEATEALLQAGAELAATQAAALAGKGQGPAQLRNATTDFQATLDRLLRRASKMPGQRGGIEANRRLRDLLQAAALGDAATRAALGGGLLTAEPAPLGFGGLTPGAVAAARPRETGRPAAGSASPPKQSGREAELEKRARRVTAARERARKAAAGADSAEALATRLEAAAEAAEEEARRTRREAISARRRAGAARRAANAAEAEVKQI